MSIKFILGTAIIFTIIIMSYILYPMSQIEKFAVSTMFDDEVQSRFAPTNKIYTGYCRVSLSEPDIYTIFNEEPDTQYIIYSQIRRNSLLDINWEYSYYEDAKGGQRIYEKSYQEVIELFDNNDCNSIKTNSLGLTSSFYEPQSQQNSSRGDAEDSETSIEDVPKDIQLSLTPEEESVLRKFESGTITDQEKIAYYTDLKEFTEPEIEKWIRGENDEGKIIIFYEEVMDYQLAESNVKLANEELKNLGIEVQSLEEFKDQIITNIACNNYQTIIEAAESGKDEIDIDGTIFLIYQNDIPTYIEYIENNC